MIDPSLYQGREQTLIKHFLFGKYLERFAIIVGSWADSITYVDGFSGPWNSRSTRLEDSSFAIALDELRRARDVQKRRKNKDLRLRCFFIEKDPSAFEKLNEFAAAQADVEIRTRNCEFEEAVPEVVQFIREAGKATFPFVFIDPKGWTGFALNTIKPILDLRPCEILINFQTSFIRRFIELESAQEDFAALFGSANFRDNVKGLKKDDREQAMLDEYARNLRAAGQFQFTCAAAVPRPESDKTHFHLIYATRDPKGLEVFKDAEFKSLPVMMQAQAEASKRSVSARLGKWRCSRARKCTSRVTWRPCGNDNWLKRRAPLKQLSGRVAHWITTRPGCRRYRTRWSGSVTSRLGSRNGPRTGSRLRGLVLENGCPSGAETTY